MNYYNLMLIIILSLLWFVILFWYNKASNFLQHIKARFNQDTESLHHAEMTISKLDYHMQFSCTGNSSQEALQGVAGLMELASQSDEVAK